MFHPVVPPQPQQPAKPVANVIDMHSHMIPASYLNAVKAHDMEMDEKYPIPSWNAAESAAICRAGAGGGEKSPGIPAGIPGAEH